MHLTRAQIIGLMSIATMLPVDATFDISPPDAEGDFFVTARAESFVSLAEGREPVWRLHRAGGHESIRELPKVPLDAGPGNDELILDGPV